MSALAPVAVLLAVLSGLIHLAVDGTGVVLAIVLLRRARVAAVLALIAFAVAVPIDLLSLAWRLVSIALPALVDQLSLSLATLQALSLSVFLVTALAGAGIWALLFSAVFADRPRVEARR